jgi:hypothetical protein
MTTLGYLLAGFYILNAGPMVASPAWWFGTTPGVSGTGPFNPHFVIDVGIAFGVSGLMIGWGAAGAGWRLVLAGSAFPAGHALFHGIGLLGGHSHGPIAVEILGVMVPAALALCVAWAMRKKEDKS